MMTLGKVPSPTAPWRPYIFRVHCLVTERWMKIRVPFAWFWYGDASFGTPEVEAGMIAKDPRRAADEPQTPRVGTPGRYPPDMPPPLDAGTLQPTQLEERQELHHPAESLEEKVDRLERIASSAHAAAYPQGYGR